VHFFPIKTKMPPPAFKDLGKKAKDLFKKSYDYKNEIKVTSKAKGVKLENGGYHNKGLIGYTKANWKDDFLGDIEVEINSGGLAKGQVKMCKIVDGVDLTLNGAACGATSLEAVYKQSNINATSKLCHNFSKSCTGLAASATVSVDSISVGGDISLDASGKPKDYNVGAEYAQKDLVAALVTANKGSALTLSVYHKWCSDVNVAATMLVKPDDGTRLYSLGTEYALDKSTGIKAKFDSKGIVGTAITHTLASPALKLCASSEFNALGDDITKAQKFGLSLHLGEF